MSAENIGGLVSITLYYIMDQLQPKTGNPLEIFSLSILLISCLPNVSKNYIMAQDKINYMNNKKGVLVSVSLGKTVSAHGAAMAFNG